MKLIGIIAGLFFSVSRKESIEIDSAVSEGIKDTFKEMGYITKDQIRMMKGMHTPPKPVDNYLKH